MTHRSMELAIIIINLLAHTASVEAKIYGLTRLYRSSTGTTIDILYDVHKRIEGLTIEQMRSEAPKAIKKKLFASEQHLLSVLDTIDAHCTHDSVDIIWESHPHMLIRNYFPQFIALGERLVKERCKNLNYIHADTCRSTGVWGLFKIDGHFFPNLTQSTLENPVPLPDSRKTSMMHRKKEYRMYQTLHLTTRLRLRIAFQKKVRSNVRLNINSVGSHPATISIADLEMLSHILASTKEHIILYAGGTHCNHIREFLLKSGAYTELFSWIHEDRTELTAQQLHHLCESYTPQSAS